jgi:hypothetical protein
MGLEFLWVAFPLLVYRIDDVLQNFFRRLLVANHRQRISVHVDLLFFRFQQELHKCSLISAAEGYHHVRNADLPSRTGTCFALASPLPVISLSTQRITCRKEAEPDEEPS